MRGETGEFLYAAILVIVGVMLGFGIATEWHAHTNITTIEKGDRQR